MSLRITLSALCIATSLGCLSDPDSPDAPLAPEAGVDGDVGAERETGPAEAGPSEFGLPEAGAPEAGAPEAGAPEAGAPEAGAPEAGVECTPRAEQCNGLDDDCDDETDEDLPGAGEPCTVGEGACAAEGVLGCLVDDAQMWVVGCGAVPGAPSPEVCNGLDDDCDGALDEGADGTGAPCTAGLGACMAEGETRCIDDGEGIVLGCDAEPGPAEDERCNGLDDDCDGAVDEGVPGAGEACAVGVGGCNGEGRRVCRAEPGQGDEVELDCDAIAGAPGPEMCNGLDDDCDEAVDEGLGGGACDTGEPGACGPGEVRCENGAERCAGRSAPAAEQCNGADDDCDGNTDEGTGGGGCNTGVAGPCAAGIAACRGGALQCDRQVQPAGEVCNGVDDDCDGRTDEGNGVADRCNGVDDDGDCRVDEGVGGVDGCNGVDDDGDCRIDENAGDCGPSMACLRDATIHNGAGFDRPQGGVPFLPTGHSKARLLMVTTYDPQNSEEFEYNVAAPRDQLLVATARGNAASYITVRVCDLSMGGVGSWASAGEQATRDNNPGVEDIRLPGLPGGWFETSFALVEAYITGGDNDLWYEVTTPQNTQLRVALGAVSNGNVQVLARGFRLRAISGAVHIGRCEANVAGNNRATCTIDPPGGVGWAAIPGGQPIIAVTRHRSGPDGNDAVNDLAHTAGCNSNGRGGFGCWLELSNPGDDSPAGLGGTAAFYFIWKRACTRQVAGCP